jgi:hypothetical protein
MKTIEKEVRQGVAGRRKYAGQQELIGYEAAQIFL